MNKNYYDIRISILLEKKNNINDIIFILNRFCSDFSSKETEEGLVVNFKSFPSYLEDKDIATGLKDIIFETNGKPCKIEMIFIHTKQVENNFFF
ncbi:MAG: hypothetical protein AABY32_01530 [Nanoarchaeota archaeon]